VNVDKQPYPFSPQVLLDGSKAATVAPAALATSTPCKGVEISALATNTDDVLIGNATSQNNVLSPGEAIYIGIDDLSKVYVTAVSGTQTVSYLGVV